MYEQFNGDINKLRKKVKILKDLKKIRVREIKVLKKELVILYKIIANVANPIIITLCNYITIEVNTPTNGLKNFNFGLINCNNIRINFGYNIIGRLFIRNNRFLALYN